MLHYVCNSKCCGSLHYTLYTEYYFLSFFMNCVLLFVCLSYLSLCCNKSKSIDSINSLYTFRYLVISSTCVILIDIHLDLTSADIEYSKFNTDILCEVCQMKVQDKICSYHLTDDGFNKRSEGVVGHKIN